MSSFPCEWPIKYSACSASTGEVDWLNLSESEETPATFTVADEYEQMAIGLLWNWTGRVFGTCPVKARPGMARDCRGIVPGSTFWGGSPAGNGWSSRDVSAGWGMFASGIQHWVDSVCGVCGENVCRCGDGSRSIALPGPVASVTAVTIDGEVLSEDAYKVARHRFLIRTDGGVWPPSQDYSKDTSEPGTFLVEYVRGIPVPVGGQIAAGALAIQLEKAACSSDDCALPQRLQSITRQGVSIDVQTAFSDVKEGSTGIWLVDAWVASVTRSPASMRTRIVSVDVR